MLRRIALILIFAGLASPSLAVEMGDPVAYVKTLGFPLIGIAAGDDIAASYSVRFIPGLMIVDAEGNIAWKRSSTDLPAGKTVGQ